MCGRFAQQRPASELAEIFAAEPLADELGARYNVAPTDRALVVVERDARRAIVGYAWGIRVPPDDSRPRRPPAFNARAETIASSPLFGTAFARRRCLVPVDAFYEWRREPDGRHPHAIRAADGQPLVLAGIWKPSRDPVTGAVIRSFAIVTTTPSEALAHLHDRMPVIVPDDGWATWLAVGRTDPADLQALLAPDESIPLTIHRVAPFVNSVRNDGPELLAPVPG